MCRTGGQPKNLLSENSFSWLVLEVRASCMRGDAYISDILDASGSDRSSFDSLDPVVLDSGCAEHGT